MQIYLPIAEQSVNAFLLLGAGGGVGFLSGLFGVGGGFLMTPLLIFIGISPAVAVATEANQIVAASFSGYLAHRKRGTVDVRMGTVLLAGGAIGAFVGVQVFKLLRESGQVDLVVKLCYVIFLGAIGSLMLAESIRAFLRRRKGIHPPHRRRRTWVDALPLKIRFRKSKIYMSVIPPFVIGSIVGVLAAIMGVGGGFIMVPAMIYILHMPTRIVVGTSLFQIMFVTGITTVLHAVENQTVDAVLALVLLIGGVIGAQIGARIGDRIQGEELRVLLALIVLGVCGQLAYDLIATPVEPFSIAAVLNGVER